MGIELAGNYPIIIDEIEVGNIFVSLDGLFWRFEAKSEMREGILRLSVYGGNQEGYLGVMTPESGSLTLNKKLSRSALKDFPTKIEYAGISGEPRKKEETVAFSSAEAEQANEPSPPLDAEPETAESVEESREIAPKDTTPQESVLPPPAQTITPTEPDSVLKPSNSWRPCAMPCSLFSDLGAKSASGQIKRAMMKKDGEFTLLAVPLSLVPQIVSANIFGFNKSAVIDGNTYVVCKIKDGKTYGVP